MINKELNDLLKIAQGTRKQSEFAFHSNVSEAALTRYFKGQRKPTPEILQKLSKRAHNGVTYQDLMIAAGYLPEDSSNQIKEVLSPKMQEASALLAQVNEKNLATVIGYLQGIVEIQREMQNENY